MNTAQEISQAEVRRSQLVIALNERAEREAALQREIDTESARIAALEKQQSDAQIEAALSQARQIGTGNAVQVKKAHTALDALAIALATVDRSALDAMRETQESQRRALDSALTLVEARAEDHASGLYSDSFADQRQLADVIRAQVRRAASNIPRAFSPKDAIGLWVKAAGDQDEKRLRQAVAYYLTGIMLDPSPDWQPENHIDPYRR